MKDQKKELIGWLKAIILAITVAVSVRVFFFETVLVEGHSMMPLINDLDKVLVSQVSYTFKEPERFDIVVFEGPEDEDKSYVKRVIGLPGETVSYIDDKLYINGQYIKEPFLEQFKQSLTEGYLTENFNLNDKIGQITVPENHVFVLGDNRRFSKDSRHIGTIPMEDIFGKGLFVYWPTDHIKWIK